MIDDSKVIDAFLLMWDKFPEAAILAHKNRQIIAVNEKAKELGREAGMNCAAQGAPESHKGCLADKAVKTGEPAFMKQKFADKEVIIYWLPINGYPEYFVHFSLSL